MTKERLIEIMNRNLYIGKRIDSHVICGKSDVADAILDELDKLKFSFQAIKPEATEEDIFYKWPIQQAGTGALTCNHPLDRILHRGSNKPPICSACGLELLEPAEKYPDTITAEVLQYFEEYVIGTDYMNNEWRGELRTIIMQYLKDRS